MRPMLSALLVFLGTYVWLVSEKSPRYIVTLTGAALLVVGHVFTLPQALAQVNWQTIALIGGMFIIVTALTESGFFSGLALGVARRLEYDPVRIFIVFPILAGVLSMFLDNITVMLFLTALTLELCTHVPINPILLITAEVCAANTGGGATLIGAPPNLVMGTTLGYGFNSFLIHMFPLSWLCLFILMGVFYLLHRRELLGTRVQDRTALNTSDLSKQILAPSLMRSGLVALSGAVVLLIIHPFVKRALHIPLTVGLAALVPALGLLVYEGRRGLNILSKIDWRSLVFFIGLFVVVGGLEKAGVFGVLAGYALTQIQNPILLILSVLWFSAIASAFVDNVPMALSMAYLIKDMKLIPGAPPEGILVWAALMGLLMGGNMTPIGGSPNVVAYGILEQKNIKVGWKTWGERTVPPTLVALIAASVLILVKFKLGWY